MANVGWVPESLRWGHAEALCESLRLLCLGVRNRAVQRLWCSIMRLLASNRVRGDFGRVREVSRLWRHLPTHATRGAPYARPALLVQVCFLLLRFGGWCPPGGTPNVDKALSILSLVNPTCCNASMHWSFPSSEGSGIR